MIRTMDRSSILLVVSLLAALWHPTDACKPAERTALLAFKAGITADSEGMLSRWVANGDCCAWGGTVCDNSGHVTQIDLAPDPAFDDDTVFLKGMSESQTLARLWSSIATAGLQRGCLHVASILMSYCRMQAPFRQPWQSLRTSRDWTSQV